MVMVREEEGGRERKGGEEGGRKMGGGVQNAVDARNDGAHLRNALIERELDWIA